MTWLLVVFLATFLLGVFATYRVREFANQRALVDRPDAGRRMHDRPVPRVGGIGIVVSVVSVLVLVSLLHAPQLRDAADQLWPLLVLLTGGVAFFGIGLYDDVRGLTAKEKLALEVLVACAVFAAGVRIGGVGIPGSEVSFSFALSLGLTVLWLVGVANAFNLVDGSDGVAAGAALFAAGVIAVVSLMAGNTLGATVAIALAGATLGFLFFNFPPASIFMGDSGSLFAGFMLAGLAVVTTQKAPTALAVAIPVVSLGLPIVDTTLTIIRRFLRGQPLFTADRGHIHHRLRDLGHSPRQVALLLYAVCGGFALLSLLLVNPSNSASVIVLVVTGLAVLVAVQRLGIPELIEVRRILNRSLCQREVIAYNVKIRESIGQLRRAHTAEGAFDALRRAFEQGEFARVELSLTPQFAPGLAQAQGVVAEPGGYRWSWARPEAEESEARLWELALPFRDATGHVVGRLSLWRPADGAHLLSDVRMVALELQPAFREALIRTSQQRRWRSTARLPVTSVPESVRAVQTPEPGLLNARPSTP
jgi:UDP-GlcNAc:undecaprenyl-phosphate/decaprenyl-phosphate GlcNAc-1-phosphate transferase